MKSSTVAMVSLVLAAGATVVDGLFHSIIWQVLLRMFPVLYDLYFGVVNGLNFIITVLYVVCSVAALVMGIAVLQHVKPQPCKNDLGPAAAGTALAAANVFAFVVVRIGWLIY